MAATFLFTQACNTAKKEDQTEVAADMNEDKVEAGQTNIAGGDEDDKEDGAEFVTMAAAGDMFEIQAAELAIERGSKHTKDMAKMIKEDHTKSSEELKTIAGMKNLTLPTAISEEQMKDLNDLKDKAGKDFDEAYAKLMTDDHQKDLDKYKEAAKDLKDAELKAFAIKTIPVLEKHHSMAKMNEDHAEKM